MSDNARFKLHDLRCFDAVIRHGSFHAAAIALNRTHPSVFAAVGRLETALRLQLLDRSGYRVEPTEAGHLFHARALGSLGEIDQLAGYAASLSAGIEPQLRVVLGDLCPGPLVLPRLAAFFATHQHTRLYLDYESVAGPEERLRQNSADLVIHRAIDSGLPVEQIALGQIQLIPVAAPGFLPATVEAEPTRERLRPFTQCVIRDTAPNSREQHFMIDGAHQCSVPDHATKRELILNRLAWGHLPDFMAEDSLHSGALVSLRCPTLPGRTETLTAARRTDRPHGPIATALWAHLASVLALSAHANKKPGFR